MSERLHLRPAKIDIVTPTGSFTTDAASHARLQWDDPMLLDRQFSDHEHQVRDAACAYAQDRLAPRVLEAFGSEKPDTEFSREWVKWDCRATIWEKYGGAGSTAFAMDWSRAKSSASILPTGR
jgi:hypothetical protein